ncbi:hypothetical protein CDD81_7027 [Ophiocordyceps australis]|uniref:JmjC domain-containing protein n=1 Tax=Ophiocordyceps australis TaxID=1399860 RepID=A0A2C5YGY0_9HYPO|nr:hypothetical protein CDD81_7027 [Ophiocordyceps australis]
MKRLPLGFSIRQWPRRLSGTFRLSAPSRVNLATPWSNTQADVEAFRQNALIPNKPLLFQRETGSPSQHLQASEKWFALDTTGTRVLSPYITDASLETLFPYELVQQSQDILRAIASFRDWLLESVSITNTVLAGIVQAALDEAQAFTQLNAPLSLLIKALEFNTNQRAKNQPTLELYVAQAGIENLPQFLKDDLKVPWLLQEAGKGDVYGSSIWLGTEPTYSPLHRDPNPNLFCQLCGDKSVRLMPPTVGNHLYFLVQAAIQQQGNSRIRSTEMMEGKERTVLHEAVWNSNHYPVEMHQANLGPGDALFIPNGWWHSVKSAKSDGQLNGSVNWWFR